MKPDALDFSLIELFTEEPHIGVLEASRRLGIARATVQARLNRLRETGVIGGFEPTIDPAAFGYQVMAMCNVEFDQNVGHQTVSEWLRTVPEVLDMYTMSGDSDILLRVVARSNADLQRVFDDMMKTKLITRTRSSIVLTTQFHNKVLPLLERAAGDAEPEHPSPRRYRRG